MTRIFGHFIARKDDQGEYLKIGFAPTFLSMQQRWRNNGLSADFLADYLSRQARDCRAYGPSRGVIPFSCAYLAAAAASGRTSA